MLNDEGKLIGLNRSHLDQHGEIYDIVAGTFLVVGLGPESFVSLSPEMVQKYTEQFKRPELFASINVQIVSVPMELENPLRTAEMILEDDYGMIDGIINNGRRGEKLEKAQGHAGEKALHLGAAGGRKTGVCGAESHGQAHPAEEAAGAG